VVAPLCYHDVMMAVGGGESVRALTVRVPPDLHRRARLLSLRRGVSLNRVLVDLLRQWVEHYELVAEQAARERLP
jgi:hypothetical protein